MQTPSASNLAKKSGLKRHDDFTKSSTNLLISLKTIKMKKKHKANANGVCMNGGINLQAGIDQHINKNEKGLSIKSIGITFANLFKPSKRIGRNTQNIIIDTSTIYFPKEFQPKTPLISVMKKTSLTTPSAKPISVNFQEVSQTPVVHKRQPSMGVKAYSIKSSRNGNNCDKKQMVKQQSMFMNDIAQAKLQSWRSELNISKTMDLLSSTRINTKENPNPRNLMPFLDNTDVFPPQPISASSSLTTINQDTIQETIPFQVSLTPIKVKGTKKMISVTNFTGLQKPYQFSINSDDSSD